MQKSFDGLPEKHQEILLGALAIRKKELREALLSQTTSISGNYLQDFDWKLKVSSTFPSSLNLIHSD